MQNIHDNSLLYFYMIRETQLSRRVAEWTQRLEPILQQQEEAEQFDIHEYCEHFLTEVDDAVARHSNQGEEEENRHDENNTANDCGEVTEIGFSEVASGKSSAEVCRIFLACLQLVNQGNISITPSGERDEWAFCSPTNGVTAADVVAASSHSRGKHAKNKIAPFVDQSHQRKRARDPFRIKLNAAHRNRPAAMDMENFRAPSLQPPQSKPMKSSLKSAGCAAAATGGGGKGKSKGAKRLHDDTNRSVAFAPVLSI